MSDRLFTLYRSDSSLLSICDLAMHLLKLEQKHSAPADIRSTPGLSCKKSAWTAMKPRSCLSLLSTRRMNHVILVSGKPNTMRYGRVEEVK